MLDSRERTKRAKEKFLAENPSVARRLEGIEARSAEALGIELEVLRSHRLDEAYREYANRLGMSAIDLTMRMTASNEAELRLLQEMHLRQRAKNLMIEWEDYARLNNISEESLGQTFIIDRN